MKELIKNGKKNYAVFYVIYIQNEGNQKLQLLMCQNIC